MLSRDQISTHIKVTDRMTITMITEFVIIV